MTPAALVPEPPRAAHPAARRRPGMVALYFAYRALAALLLAAPLSLHVGSLLGHHPRGDALLFEPGGLLLTEMARLSEPVAPALGAQLGLGALLAAALGLLPLAALIVSLGRAGPLTASFIAARVARALGPLALLWGVALLAQVVAAALTLLLGAQLLDALVPSASTGDLAQLALTAAALLAALAVGVVHDLARIAAAHQGLGFYDAAARALAAARAAPGSFAWSWTWRVALAALALLAAAWAGSRLGLSTGAHIALAFALHHAALFAAAWLRASWLAAAIRQLDRLTDPLPPPLPEPPPEPSAGTGEGSTDERPVSADAS